MPHRKTVKTVMTPFPYAIGWEQSVEEAVQMMESHEIRHLPVTQDSELYGIVAEADLRVVRALGEQQAVSARLQVGLICSTPPYTVDLETPIPEVIEGMLSRHISSAIVTRHGQLAGIVTTTDFCEFLAQLLRKGPLPDATA